MILFVYIFISSIYLIRNFRILHEIDKYTNDFKGRIRYNKPILTVINGTNIKSGDIVTVTWDNIWSSSVEDQIRLYCPPSLDDSKFLGSISRETHDQLIGNKYGTIDIRIYYTRTDCEFRYLQKGKNDQMISILNSGKITFDHHINEPHQVHLSLTGDPSQMRITWISGINSSSPAFIKRLSDNLETRYESVVTRYTADMMCHSPATDIGFIDPGYIHSVIVDKLHPETTYSYTIGNKIGSSTPRTFVSSKSIGIVQNESTIINFYGDWHFTESPGGYSTIENLERDLNSSKRIDMLLQIGDISYAEGIGYKWDMFGHLFEPLFSRIPYIMTIGNHEHGYVTQNKHDSEHFTPYPGEYDKDSGGECSIPVNFRYPMPKNGNSPFWYSFNYAQIHLIALSAEHDFQQGTPQYLWLMNDFKKIDRNLTPWVIVNIHRSLYISYGSDCKNQVSDLLKTVLEPILIENKVDFVLTGHYHVYERTCPVNKNKCVSMSNNDNWGIVHLTVGTAGRNLDTCPSLNNEWKLFHSKTHGYGQLEIINSTDAEFRFISNPDHIVLDKAYYKRNHNF